MNGRIYDPTLGRFLQADPFIQAPMNSQSYNRYSYVLNNPLSYTDPSGYFFKSLFKKINKALGKFAPIVGIAIGLLAGPWAAQAWYNAALVGFVSGGVATGSLKGALIGAFTGAAFQQIGAHFRGVSAQNVDNVVFGGGQLSDYVDFGGNLLTRGQVAGQIASHAVAGGVVSTLSGGKFGHGFIAAGFTKAVGTPLASQANGNLAGEAVVHMAIGGTASVISGGKFANGARTAAYQLLFNGWGSRVVKSAARKIWTITPVGTSKVMRHDRFGKFYKSKSDGSWWSVDQAGHGDSYWKVFKETKGGLEWVSDADRYGNFITGKHKGPTGLSISWKELNAVSGWEKGISTSLIIGITVLEVIDPTTYIMSPPMDPMDRLPDGSNGGG